jgi:4a-hydroxytetrahydrobiopterin dehydratase
MWKEENNKLIFERNFRNQSELAQFFVSVAKLADERDHHPNIMVTQCSHLRLELFTHTTNSVTNLDRQLANDIELLIE